MSIYYTEANGTKIEYELTRKQIKNINIRVKADGSVHVSSPKRVKIDAVKNFVDSNAEAISRAIEKLKKKTAVLNENETRLLGKRYTVLAVCKSGEDCPEHEIINDKMVLYLDDPADPNGKEKALLDFKKELCKKTVLPICQELFPEFEEAIGKEPKISFKSMKTRWGSCNPKKGRLNFSIMLADEPIEFVEYVVLHEFTHFLRADHSDEFYRLILKRMPDYKSRKKLCGKTE